MSLKAKLISTISAFCLVIALLVVGVLAVNPAKVNMGGNITFSATDVMATISANVTGISGSHSFDNIVFDETTDDGNATNTSWTNLNFTFANKTTDIVLTITITNDSDERDFTVAYTAPTGINNVDVTSKVTNADEPEDDYSEAITVTKGTSATIKITFHITDNSKSAGGAWNVSLDLTNKAA